MASPNQEGVYYGADHATTVHNNRNVHTPSLSRKRPSASRSSSRSHREFQILTPSQKIGRHRQYPFPPLTEPKPSTRCVGAENIWPPPCSTSPFVTPGAGANIGRRRRANAISLVDSPSRRGHSQAMARIFEDAHRVVAAQDGVRNWSLYSTGPALGVEQSRDIATATMPCDATEPDHCALGTVRVKRSYKRPDHEGLLGNVRETSNDDRSHDELGPVPAETNEGMPENEIKSWLEGVFEHDSEQTVEKLPSSLSHTFKESNDKQPATSPSELSDKENNPPEEDNVLSRSQNSSPGLGASCLSTLLKSAPRRGKIQTRGSTPVAPVSLATRWRPALIPSQTRGRSSKRSDSVGTGQPHAKSAVVTHHAKVIIEDDEPKVLSEQRSSDSSSEEFVDASSLPFVSNAHKTNETQTDEKLRVDSNATTAIEHTSLPSRSPSPSAPGLASALAIKVEKRKSSPQNSEELHAILSNPSASAKLLEASGFQRTPSCSFPNPSIEEVHGTISPDGSLECASTSHNKSRVLTPEVQRFRKGKGPEKPRCPSYYDEDLEETTPRRSARLARK